MMKRMLTTPTATAPAIRPPGSDDFLTVTTNNRISRDGVYHYEYDDEGNRSKRITLVLNPLTGLMEPTGPYEEYTYDHRNRLDQITYKNSSGTVLSFVRYRYDHENVYTNGVAGTNTYNLYVHDGDQIVSAFTRGATGGTKLSNRYLWGPQVDQLISDEQVTSMTAAGTTYWALENPLNSVVDLVTYNAGTDTTSVAKHRTYDSFGNVVSDSAPGVTQLFGFTGKMLDAKTGLQWNINRWYDAKLGQWISEDPIGFAGGDENLRRYVGNDPGRRVDRTGLQAVEGIFSGLGSGVGQIATDILGYLAARVEGTLMAARAIVSASLPNCMEVQVDVQWSRFLGGVTIHAFKKAAPKPEVVVPPPTRIIAAAMVRRRIPSLISRVAPSTHVLVRLASFVEG
jgi:RHS repeat-associated protein